MGEYQKSLRDIIALLDPDASRNSKTPRAAKAPTSKRARRVKQYKNPHSGEVIETKGGNHKTLKEWKANGAPTPWKAGPLFWAKQYQGYKERRFPTLLIDVDKRRFIARFPPVTAAALFDSQPGRTR